MKKNEAWFTFIQTRVTFLIGSTWDKRSILEFVLNHRLSLISKSNDNDVNIIEGEIQYFTSSLFQNP